VTGGATRAWRWRRPDCVALDRGALRAEPDLKARELRITYRCLECALLDRRTI
jgi:hypothetical protein